MSLTPPFGMNAIDSPYGMNSWPLGISPPTLQPYCPFGKNGINGLGGILSRSLEQGGARRRPGAWRRQEQGGGRSKEEAWSREEEQGGGGGRSQEQGGVVRGEEDQHPRNLVPCRLCKQMNTLYSSNWSPPAHVSPMYLPPQTELTLCTAQTDGYRCQHHTRG